MSLRALIVVIALGAGAAAFAVVEGHSCDGHAGATMSCDCGHLMRGHDCGMSVDASCCCADAPSPAVVPPAEIGRTNDAPVTVVSGHVAAVEARPPSAPLSDFLGGARAPPSPTLLAQRTSFLC